MRGNELTTEQMELIALGKRFLRSQNRKTRPSKERRDKIKKWFKNFKNGEAFNTEEERIYREMFGERFGAGNKPLIIVDGLVGGWDGWQVKGY